MTLLSRIRINLITSSNMEIKYFVGIDFGHGETSVSRVPGYDTEAISQVPLRKGSKDEDKKVLSAICREGNTWRLVFDQCDFSAPSLREGFKGPIDQLRKQNIEDLEALKEFGKLIFKTVLDNDKELEYNSTTGECNFAICIATPSEWRRLDANIPQEYLKFFKEECGIAPAILCINESDAAFFSKYDESSSAYSKSDSVFVIDLGSSTIDYTTYSNGKCIPDGCDGANLGAHIIENQIISKALQANKENLKKAEALRGELGIERKIDAALSLFARLAKEKFYTNKAKSFVLRISFGDLAPINVDHDLYLEDAFRVKLTADEFESVISDYREQLDRSLESQARNLRENVMITPKHVILSGGASRMKFVENLTAKHFPGPNSKIHFDNHPEWVVSNGAAMYMKAHYTALQTLLRKVGNIDFEAIYKSSDIEATRKATVDLMPSVIEDITGSTDYNAIDIVQKFCEFFFSLNSQNPEYVRIFTATAKEMLKQKVCSEINDAIYNVFKINVDLSDISLDTDFALFNWRPEFWSPGGYGCSVVTKTIKEAGKELVFFSFDIDAPRNKSERQHLAEAGRSAFTVSNPFDAQLDPEHLKDAATRLKKETLELAERIFYDKELFQTSTHKS